MAESNAHEGSKTAQGGPRAPQHLGLAFKRKTDQKSNYKSATDDEDIESAPSLKSSSNPPLPQLQKEKRKLLIKPFGSLQSKNSYAFVEKEVRQHDNILLKQRNNLMTTQNMKLKTRISVLQKENQRLQKILDNQTSQMKPSTAYAGREKLRPADSTMRAVIRGLRKEIQDLKKENVSIKSAVKFTSLKEIQTQRDHLAEQTIRLRMALEEEIAKRPNIRANHHGVSALQHRLHQLSDRNAQLTKEHVELQQKYKKMQQTAAKATKAIQNEKNLQKALNNARRTINQKEVEIQLIKGQLKTTSSIPASTGVLGTPKQNKFQIRRPSIDKKGKLNVINQRKEVASGSVPKTTQNLPKNVESNCTKCPKLQEQIKSLTQKLKQLQSELQKIGNPIKQMMRQPIQKVKQQQISQMRRFLTLRFKAHRLTYQQSQKYLVNCQGQLTAQQRNKDITARQLMQSLFVQPFCIVSNRYLQVLIVTLIYGEIKQPLILDQNKKVKKGDVLNAYSKLMPKYEVMSQEKQEQMFIQVAQLITTYYQQIMAALTAKRNGQGTIPQRNFLEFFLQIQLQQQYTDFIITQIILESLDMQHLNFYAMFQIFYMPQMNPPTQPNSKKKKFEVANQNVVHEEEEEYEQSKSHLGSRNKTLEHQNEHDEQDYAWQQDPNNKQQPPKQPQGGEEEYYEEEYEEEKMENEPLEVKAKSYVIEENFQS